MRADRSLGSRRSKRLFMRTEQILLLLGVLALFAWRARRLSRAIIYYYRRYRYHKAQRIAAESTGERKDTFETWRKSL
jgi:hypothetical protein